MTTNKYCVACIHANDDDGWVCDTCHERDKHCHIEEDYGFCEKCVHHAEDVDSIPCKFCLWINERGSDMWEPDDIKDDDDDEFVPDYENKTKVYL